ncbi:MAG: Hsp20/alpha crystallin family protein [Myxococcota bacterium]|nr:Hsp20/alpha crystallin family protein [Myxococcota bacterium]
MFRFYPVHTQTPFDVIKEFQRNFEEFGLLRPARLFENVDFGPRVVKTENEDTYQVTLEAPGITKKDVSITIEKDVLTIEGKREQKIPEGFEVIRQERNSLEFIRRLMVPENVDQTSITARFENGLLVIDLPKKPKEKPRRIEINAVAIEEEE